MKPKFFVYPKSVPDLRVNATLSYTPTSCCPDYTSNSGPLSVSGTLYRGVTFTCREVACPNEIEYALNVKTGKMYVVKCDHLVRFEPTTTCPVYFMDTEKRHIYRYQKGQPAVQVTEADATLLIDLKTDCVYVSSGQLWKRT